MLVPPHSTAMPTMKCPICQKEIEVRSKKEGLRPHIAAAHPEELAKMNERQAVAKRVCPVEWRCLNCESRFSDTDVYQAHYRGHK
jgi:DNA-directed RNA polymerase subunit RPC12/RpoP